MKQARFPRPRLGNSRDDLPATLSRQFERPIHFSNFTLAADKLGQPALRRKLEVGAQLPDGYHLKDVDRLAYSLDQDRPHLLEIEIPLNQSLGILADSDRAHRCNSLQPLREMGREPHGCVFGVTRSVQCAQDDLTGVHSDAGFDSWAPLGGERCRVLFYRLLHSESGVQR